MRLGSGCSTAQSLALEERLQHLQVQERVQTQQLLRSLFSPAVRCPSALKVLPCVRLPGRLNASAKHWSCQAAGLC